MTLAPSHCPGCHIHARGIMRAYDRQPDPEARGWLAARLQLLRHVTMVRGNHYHLLISEEP